MARAVAGGRVCMFGGEVRPRGRGASDREFGGVRTVRGADPVSPMPDAMFDRDGAIRCGQEKGV